MSAERAAVLQGAGDSSSGAAATPQRARQPRSHNPRASPGARTSSSLHLESPHDVVALDDSPHPPALVSTPAPGSASAEQRQASGDSVSTADKPGVTSTARISALTTIGAVIDQDASSPAIRILPRDQTTPLATAYPISAVAVPHQASEESQPTLSLAASSLLQPASDASARPASTFLEDKMIFGHNATLSSVAHRRRVMSNTSALTGYEADLTNKDRAKQKEAVRKYLAEKVKDTWTWEWPGPEPEPSAEETLPSEEAIAETNVRRWKERDEWESNASESGEDSTIPPWSKENERPASSVSKGGPFRFESPDGVGDIIMKGASDRKRRRKKRLADEMAWNQGLRCFVKRRDAWTGARRVPKVPLGFSRIRTDQRASTSVSSEDGGSSTAVENEGSDNEWEDDTEIPVARPLLPPANAMRASITPEAYYTIYDKVILQQLTPSCPMNLRDVTRSCVQGWKRDGEWPPKVTVADVPAKKKKGRKLSVASILRLDKGDKDNTGKGEEKESEKSSGGGGGIRRGLQRILSLGKESGQNGTATGNTTGKTKEGEITTVTSV